MMNDETSSTLHSDTPLGYAQSTCDTMMRRYAVADLPPKGHFHYHQGVFLSGVYKTYQLCGNEAYFSYMKDWVDSVFTADGKIKNFYNHADLDDIQPGILLFPLLEKTGDEKYRKCIESVAALSKAVRQKLLPESALDAAKKGYEGVIRSLNWEGSDLLIGNVCVGTGVGNYDFYRGRPRSTNDLHGVGAFLLMCTELQLVLGYKISDR